MGAIETYLQPASTGVRYDLDIDAYHSGVGVSKSQLDDLARSPAIFHALHLAADRPAPRSRAGQLEGNLAHCAILEPHLFDQRYAIGPTVNRNTKVWKDFVDANPNRICIQAEQRDAAMAQAASVHALPEVRDALAIGRAEVSAYWADEQTGILCRCRPDWVHPLADNRAILVDVKTCGDASPGEFVRQAARKRYDVQDAFYSEGFGIAAGVEVLAFIFAAVETEYPYAASAVILGDESRAAGQRKFRADLATYAECRAANNWPGFSDQIQIVNLPNWAMKEAVE